MTKLFPVAALVGSLTASAAAQEGFSHGRIRHVEPNVTLQRETETGSEEAASNSPLLPGDRVWSDGAGRAEFQFPDGTVLRLDRRGKLDYVAHEERPETIVLKLWSGGLYVRTREAREGALLQIETPAGLVEIEERGVVRVDVESGETRLSVYDGEAALVTGSRRMEVGAGERAYVRAGEAPEPARRFDAREEDDFSAWDRDREGQRGFADDGRSYLPEDLHAYSGELASNGVWRYEASVGNVWQPYVSSGWRPYVSGRWTWTSYGWTWVPAEPWGWAPFHYGRWGHSASFGWYWIPGRTWGPAWVSWASGGDYIGWCPLGYRDRPVYGYGHGYGYRGSSGYATYRGAGNGPGWSFVNRGEMKARDISRYRRDRPDDGGADVRVVDSPHARPTRDLREFRVVEGGARLVPRATVRTRPAPTDTAAPELRADRPTTTVPFAQPRSDARRYGRREPEAARDERATDARSPRRGGGGSDAPPAADVTREPRAEERRVRPRPEAREAPAADRDADHDVLKRFFRPLEPRPKADAESGDQGGRARSRGEGRSGSDRPSAFRPAPRTEGGDGSRTRDDNRGTSTRGGGASREDSPRTARPAPAPRPERQDPPSPAPRAESGSGRAKSRGERH